jgi:hypothetical protein
MTMTSKANPVAGPKGDEDMDDVRGGGIPVDEDGSGMLAFMIIYSSNRRIPIASVADPSIFS